MQHLTLDELARLVDERPSAADAEHLERCGACAAELREIHEQTEALRGLPDPPAPEGLRGRIEEALADEGLLPVRAAPRATPWMAGLRIAAGFVLFMLGTVTGAFVLTPEPAPPQRLADEAQGMGVSEAAAALRVAEQEYLRAVTRYAEVSDDGEMLDPLDRLVALEGIVLTTEAALRDAPADPIINNFHLTAVGQREALLRQIDMATNEDEWF
ncbi:MAG: hypothetical protein WD766_12500 [Gemmatimonadota bacterium]